MSAPLNIAVSLSTLPHASLPSEICEHKGTGHPDSICDGVAEAASQALCSAYLHAYGEVRHHNVDKALLIGGRSEPKFGGGRLIDRMRLIIAGRADPLPASMDIAEIVCAAARNYIATHLHCPSELFDIESAVRGGSPNLRRVMSSAATFPLANDTSFGVGFAPYSQLEQTVLDVAAFLGSAQFRTEFPAAGDDFKVMGVRIGDRIGLTVALAFIDRHVESAAHYFRLKGELTDRFGGQFVSRCEFRLNALDAPGDTDESGMYVTVTGLSAEHGDDGQVGRGNRVSGLITPSRAMSLEAAAGKNPIAHVGKIYNVFATELANMLIAQVPGISEAEVQLVSCIGQPIDRPELIDIKIVVDAAAAGASASLRAREIATEQAGKLHFLTQRLLQGKFRLF